MRRHGIAAVLFFFIFFSSAIAYTQKNETAQENILKNGGFEAALIAPWGTGLYSEGRTAWWNSGNCRSTAEIDRNVKRSGLASLHIMNQTPRSPNVFGTTAQRVKIRENTIYRITLWAKGKDLASRGAVNIIVDPYWKIRPIFLPAGTFDWTEFSGTFSLVGSDHADIRILSEDKGEAWIDDISVTPLGPAPPPDEMNANGGIQGKHQHAVALKDPADSSLLRSALDAYDSGNYAAALPFFQQLTAKEPDNAQLWIYSGLSSYRSDHIEEAAAAFEKAVQMEASHPVPEVHFDLGLSYFRLSRYPEAVKAFQQAISLRPDYEKAYQNLGRTYFRLQQYGDSVKACEEAVKLNPDDALAHALLGASSFMLGNSEKAQKEYETLKTLHSNLAEKLHQFMEKRQSSGRT